MQEIADRLGISKVSVSKALGGRKGVSDELRRKITTLAYESGYRNGDLGGDHIGDGSSLRFAFVVPKYFFLETDAFYSEIYYYFNKYCLERNYSAQLVIISGTDEAQSRIPAQLAKEHYHGIAVAGEISDSYIKIITASEIPTVTVDFAAEGSGCPAILTDNFYWGFHATNYLIELGHREIGFVGPVGSTDSITDRYFGYRRALLSGGIDFDERRVMANNDTTSGKYRLDIDLPDPLPTAFVCHCDCAAHYLINTLSARGLSCPADFSIVSFDNTRLAQTNTPPLTCVDINTHEFARLALDTLCDILLPNRQKPDLHQAEIPSRIYLPSDFIIRCSAAPNPTGK